MKICPSFLIAWASHREVNSRGLLKPAVSAQTQVSDQKQNQSLVLVLPPEAWVCCASPAASSDFCPVDVSLSFPSTNSVFAAPTTTGDVLSTWSLTFGNPFEALHVYTAGAFTPEHETVKSAQLWCWKFFSQFAEVEITVQDGTPCSDVFSAVLRSKTHSQALTQWLLPIPPFVFSSVISLLINK